ncbi:unnamed protein product [Phytomonas sp. Hart1]|nr:unnamed protein product [Phytomonas sp. Hart1]|eukprot:CCW70218.1 unnamed protein product [Phytomonas sp. isolate Hart1]
MKDHRRRGCISPSPSFSQCEKKPYCRNHLKGEKRDRLGIGQLSLYTFSSVKRDRIDGFPEPIRMITIINQALRYQLTLKRPFFCITKKFVWGRGD